ncbi:transporter substrate-binding protein [Phaeovulum sp.]|uniref:transporter substrate-binding protein n=1 Tax=Phaeovulum sp. TaxID=2934796 RepID=UPI0035643474
MRKRVEIGLLYSREGNYARISEACRLGALSAIEAINTTPDSGSELIAIERDPRGNIDLYQPLCTEILRETSARHVVGCVTSWSRKEVIPALEKAGGTLWYACPYEGFEASDSVVYTHACPNQHLLPLLQWAFPRYGRRGYLTGSNYIWGWEMNRVARDQIAAANGAVLGERYLPIGDVDVSRIIDEIRATRPDFILNSLIGPSSYRFLQAYAELGREDAHFTAATCPVLSCNLTECELGELGAAAEGLISVGPYFNDAQAQLPGAGPGFGSSLEAAAYSAVFMLAGLLAQPDTREAASLGELLAGSGAARSGIDPETHHVALPVLIAQVEGGRFRVRESWHKVAADPYLSHSDRIPAARRPRLSVVR